MYIIVFGEGWAPAILNSAEELAFIREGQAGNKEVSTYWIGGSIDAIFTVDNVDIFSRYIPDGSGNYIVHKVTIHSVAC